MNCKDDITFTINGKPFSVNSNDERLNEDSRLVDFIRDRARLKGTKWTCREGGCGACVVSVKTKNPQNGMDVVRAVNSCLAPVFSCDGWEISTIEDLGNRHDGFHPIQKRLAQLGGTQCGFCTPGMIMNMMSLTSSKAKLTEEEIENSFDGNICRCTGYRPILDAFKSFAGCADPAIMQKFRDIEDCMACPAIKAKNSSGANETNGSLNGTANGNAFKNGGCCSRENTTSSVELNLPSGISWIKATDLKSTLQLLERFAKDKVAYIVVAGNTGTGIFKSEGPFQAFIDVNHILDLTITGINKSEAVFGAGLTLTRTIEFLDILSTREGFEYAAGMSKHIKRVANTPVRNIGTIAGNVMLKHAHREFPSDIFILLETVGAKVQIASASSKLSSVTLLEFLDIDMTGKLIVSFSLPSRIGYTFRSFKITKRHQNAHAYVNAGFMLKIDAANGFRVLEKPSITFGGINPNFVHAYVTENILTGAQLSDEKVIQNALQSLENEISPNYELPDAAPDYRKNLTNNLLFKTLLGIVGNSVSERHRSGAEDLPRGPQSGKQYYDTDDDFKESALYKPVVKLEAMLQCSGEAQYVNDIETQQGELAGAFVLSTVANADLKSVDASEALKVSGVITFITAKDVPGRNSYFEGSFGPVQCHVFIEKEVPASGLPIGLIVAETREIAMCAAKKVKVEYCNQRKPALKICEIVDEAKTAGNFETDILYPNEHAFKSEIESPETFKHVIRGKIDIGGQAHFHMENHVTLVIPKEDGYTVYSATQWMDHVQGMIAQALGIPNNSIDIQVRRLGGTYGAKFVCASQIAIAAAVASKVTRKPVRVVLDLENGLEMIGKRLPYYAEYEAGFDETGKIEKLHVNAICDTGYLEAVPTILKGIEYMQSCYNVSGWQIHPGKVSSNTHVNWWCRAPGSIQSLACIETVMEHIADELNKCSWEVRAANYLKAGDELMPVYSKQIKGQRFEGENLIPEMVEDMKRIGNYEQRVKDVDEFNKKNRWRKRGLAMTPMRYVQGYMGFVYSAFVAVHNQDGTVSVSVAGVECGQGLNTKIAQVVAHELEIPLSLITIKPSNNFVAANSFGTAAAITSELNAYATIRACQTLRDRMSVIKKGNEDMTWQELVKKCHQAGVDLRATFQYDGHDEKVKPYDVFGLNLTEVEVDILTGEFKIARVDLIEDAGKSMSPEVDIGQIEGSLVMGLGLWTEEKLVFDPQSGRLLTRNTWEYKVPLPKCIPEDLRVVIMKKGSNPFGVLRSKATGEPPICLAVAVLFAIRNAIKSARQDAGNHEWFILEGPVTPEQVVRLSLTDPTRHFRLN